jgi:hypothetical protein
MAGAKSGQMTKSDGAKSGEPSEGGRRWKVANTLKEYDSSLVR